MAWQDVCTQADLEVDSGVCALVAGKQIALFYLSATAKVYAVSNFDPIGKANVLARGIIGDIGGQPVVASPLYKQHFNLETGVCLEDETWQISSYPARIENGKVELDLN
jgi:nitrite reductase (NADH) small subunit